MMDSKKVFNKSNRIIIVGAMVLLLLLSSSPAFALHSKGHTSSAGLEHILLKKLYFVLGHEEGLELTGEQVQQLKDLKVSIKSDVIRGNAEVDVHAYHIAFGLGEYEVNTVELKASVAKKHEAMADLDTKIIDAFGQLQSILTEEQLEKAKKWWHTGKK